MFSLGAGIYSPRNFKNSETYVCHPCPTDLHATLFERILEIGFSRGCYILVAGYIEV